MQLKDLLEERFSRINTLYRVVGCFKCQEVCPQNYKKGQEIIIPLAYDFIEQIKTSFLYEDLDQKMKEILECYSINTYFKVLKRNMEVLM